MEKASLDRRASAPERNGREGAPVKESAAHEPAYRETESSTRDQPPNPRRLHRRRIAAGDRPLRLQRGPVRFVTERSRNTAELVFLALAAGPATADKLHLKGGGELECDAVREGSSLPRRPSGAAGST